MERHGRVVTVSPSDDKLSQSGINSMTTPPGGDPYNHNHNNNNNMIDGEEETRKGPWTVEEDMRLTRYVTIHGEGRWNFLSRAAGLRRNGKSCRLRWVNYLRPDVKRGNITPDEERLIADLHSRWGNRWSRIAQSLPGRTDNEIKNYWRTRIKRIINGRGNRSLERFSCSTNASAQRDRNTAATALSNYGGFGETEDIGNHFKEPLSDTTVMKLTDSSDVGRVDSLKAGIRISNEFGHERQNIACTSQFQNQRSEEALKGGFSGFDPLPAPLKDDILCSNFDSLTALLSELYAVQDHAGAVPSCRAWPERVLSSGSFFPNGDFLTPCDSAFVWSPHDLMIHNGSSPDSPLPHSYS